MKYYINTATQKNFVIINIKTGEEFYGDDPYKLMNELSDSYVGQGTEFKVVVLNPKIKFLMK